MTHSQRLAEHEAVYLLKYIAFNVFTKRRHACQSRHCQRKEKKLE